MLLYAICKLRRGFEISWQVAEWFAPAVSSLLKCVPFFFAPPLVQLPVALAPLSTYNIFKMLLVVASGSLVGSLATGVCVERIWGVRPYTPSNPSSNTRCKESGEAATSAKTSGTLTSWLPPAWASAAGNHTHTYCFGLLNSQKLRDWLCMACLEALAAETSQALRQQKKNAKQRCLLTT